VFLVVFQAETLLLGVLRDVLDIKGSVNGAPACRTKKTGPRTERLRGPVYGPVRDAETLSGPVARIAQVISVLMTVGRELSRPAALYEATVK
jgi:hypothetical protein